MSVEPRDPPVLNTPLTRSPDYAAAYADPPWMYSSRELLFQGTLQPKV